VQVPDVLHGIVLALQRTQNQSRVIAERVTVKPYGRDDLIAQQSISQHCTIWSRQASVFKINAMQSAVDTQGVSQCLATLGTHAVPAYAEHCDRVVGLQSLHKVSQVKQGVN
jgi:hypothetical protein